VTKVTTIGPHTLSLLSACPPVDSRFGPGNPETDATFTLVSDGVDLGWLRLARREGILWAVPADDTMLRTRAVRLAYYGAILDCAVVLTCRLGQALDLFGV
jgi:hypothetical protein